jgi:hypothetical protein
MSGFTIPNTPDSFNQNQAEPDSLDFQILGNQRSGVVSGCAVSPNATAQKVTVAAGEVLINGSYYPYAGGIVDLTAYASPAFFDVIYARLSGSTVTCYAVAPATGSTNPRFPSSGSGANQVNLDTTDVVLASIYRVDNGVVDSGAIVDKRVFVRSTTNRTLGDTVSANRGSAGDTFVNTSWTPGSTTASPFSVKVGSTWYNLAYWTANSNISTSGTITAGSFVGPLSGNATTATSATSATSAGTVPWSGVSGKPSLVENNGGTYSINITGSAPFLYNSTYGIYFSLINAGAWGTAATINAYSYISTGSTDYQFTSSGQYTYLGEACLRVVNATTAYTQLISAGRTALISSNSSIGTSVSSRRFKENIVEYTDLTKRILNVNPVTFDYKSEHIEEDSQDTRFNQFGLIAEDMHDAGLTHLVYYDKTEQPEAINYTMLAVELLGVIKQQENTITELTARVEALEGK